MGRLASPLLEQVPGTKFDERSMSVFNKHLNVAAIQFGATVRCGSCDHCPRLVQDDRVDGDVRGELYTKYLFTPLNCVLKMACFTRLNPLALTNDSEIDRLGS